MSPEGERQAGTAGAQVVRRDLDAACPACGASGLEGFYSQDGVPSHSCLLLDSAGEAERFPRGDIELALCRRCGFIANAAVEPALQAYSAQYEETQGFSPRFREFAHALARDLVERHDVRGREVLEIGCGKGEFLVDLCRLGGNRGVGIDPAVAPERFESDAGGIEWIRDYWSEDYAHLTGDLVVCRHTLEHIPEPGRFLRLLRRAIGDRRETVVFFELPDMGRVLREAAFWDVYYEHCSYYTPGTLARQFRLAGFEPTRLWLGFDDQYVLLESRPADARDLEDGAPKDPAEEPVAAVERAVEDFRTEVERRLGDWRDRLRRAAADGRRAVIWGSGSKGVSFLTTLGVEREVRYAVDINPHRHGKHMAGTGQLIVPPEYMAEYRPDLVIAMNPIYREEIGRELERLGVDAELLAL